MNRLYFWIPLTYKEAFNKGEIDIKLFTCLVIQFSYGVYKSGRMRPGVHFSNNAPKSKQFENSCMLMRSVLTVRGAKSAMKILQQSKHLIKLINHWHGHFKIENHGDILLVNDEDKSRVDPRILHKPYLDAYTSKMQEFSNKSVFTGNQIDDTQVSEVKNRLNYFSRFQKVGPIDFESLTNLQFYSFIEEFSPYEESYQKFIKVKGSTMFLIKHWFNLAS